MYPCRAAQVAALLYAATALRPEVDLLAEETLGVVPTVGDDGTEQNSARVANLKETLGVAPAMGEGGTCVASGNFASATKAECEERCQNPTDALETSENGAPSLAARRTNSYQSHLEQHPCDVPDLPVKYYPMYGCTTTTMTTTFDQGPRLGHFVCTEHPCTSFWWLCCAICGFCTEGEGGYSLVQVGQGRDRAGMGSCSCGWFPQDEGSKPVCFVPLLEPPTEQNSTHVQLQSHAVVARPFLASVAMMVVLAMPASPFMPLKG